MTPALAALLGAAGAACPQLPAAEAVDAAEAQAYLEVAEASEARGDAAAAAFAFAQAARHGADPGRAGAGLERVCAPAASSADALEQATARLEAGDCREVLRLLEPAPARRLPAAQLVFGICALEAGRPAEAEAALAQAESDPSLAGPARFYLALAAFERGEMGRARAQLAAAVRQAPQLEPAARPLAWLARRSGRLELSAAAGAAFDSNVDQAPGTTLFPSGSADGAADVAVEAKLAPLPPGGPWLRLDGSYRKLFRLGQFDCGAVGAGAGYALVVRPVRATASYRFAFTTLGQELWSLAHALAASLALRLGPVALSAGYQGTNRSFLSAEAAGFSGWVHGAGFEVAWSAGPWAVRGGYQLQRDFTAAPALGRLEHGPELGLQLAVAGRARLEAHLAVSWRAWDGVDPDLQVARRDTVLAGALGAEVDLTSMLSAYARVDGRYVLSNVAELQYGRLAAAAGLAFALGVW